MRVQPFVCIGRASVRWTALALCAVLVLSGSAGRGRKTNASVSDPLISVHDGFVDEKTCASCHADQAAAFAKSHHARRWLSPMKRRCGATSTTSMFDHDGAVATFSRRDGRFFVRTEGPDGKPADFEVKYTFAYEPLQQYLVDLGGGRLQALDIAWDTQKRECSGWAKAVWAKRRPRHFIGRVRSIAGTAPASTAIPPIRGAFPAAEERI